MQGIADYEFVRSLGDAGHGELFLAVPPARLGTDAPHVGVKVLPGANDATGLRRATRELRAFASVQSPYLVELLDAGRQGDYFYYAMAYSSRGSLASPDRPLTRAETRAAVAAAARAAHALHEAGLVHRGIAPSNVLLTEDGARLADLSLVQALTPTQTMTGLGSVGAVEYLEPSLLAGQPATPLADVWSLGVTLHRALAGEGVYGELPDGDVLIHVRAVLSGRPRISERLTPAEADLVSRCISADPSGRPASALALAEEIEALP